MKCYTENSSIKLFLSTSKQQTFIENFKISVSLFQRKMFEKMEGPFFETIFLDTRSPGHSRECLQRLEQTGPKKSYKNKNFDFDKRSCANDLLTRETQR